MVPFEVVARAFKEFTVVDATRTGGFAGPAAETKVEVRNGVGEWQPTTLHGTHEVDAATRRIVLVARLQVGRAGAEAEPAMHTGEGFLLVEEWFRRGRHSVSSGRM